MSCLCFILPSGLARIRGKCSGKVLATVNVQKLSSSAAFISQMQALNEQKTLPISNLHIFPPGKSYSNESRTFTLESLCVSKTTVPPNRLYFYLESVLPPHLRNQARFYLVAWSWLCSDYNSHSLSIRHGEGTSSLRVSSCCYTDGQAQCGGAESNISGQTRSLLFTRLPPRWTRFRALLFHLWDSSPRAPVHISPLPQDRSEGSVEICHLPLNCAPAASLVALSEATPKLFTRQP